MQQINQLVTRATQSDEQTSRTQSQTTSAQQASDFTAHERDVTGYLFVRYKAMYPHKFDFIWPSEKELALTKREYAKTIGRYTRQQIDQALEYCRSMAAKGEKEYLEPNPLITLRVLGDLNTNTAMYKLLPRAKPESDEERQRRIELGRQKSSELLTNLFGDSDE